MPDQKLHLDITNDSVSVRLNGDSGKKRFYALAFFSALTVIGMGLLLFLPGKGGSPSIWHNRSASYDLVLTFPLFMFVLTKRYVRLAYASDETFRCDRSTLSIARVRWFDFRDGHWNSSSFALAEVRKIEYRVLTSMRGTSIYGLRLKAGGKTLRVLPWLKAADAERILLALKSLGADVPDDPVVPSKLKENQWGS
jgi:hypothetical protein